MERVVREGYGMKGLIRIEICVAIEYYGNNRGNINTTMDKGENQCKI